MNPFPGFAGSTAPLREQFCCLLIVAANRSSMLCRREPVFYIKYCINVILMGTEVRADDPVFSISYLLHIPVDTLESLEDTLVLINYTSTGYYYFTVIELSALLIHMYL